jgi:hypothetical protein
VENSGRSRVALSALSGIADNGLPVRGVALGLSARPAPDGAAPATPFPCTEDQSAST